MTDLRYDTNINDLVVVNGDFDTINRCSEQNGDLLLRKSAASIIWPQFGVGFEQFYMNLPQVYWGQVQTAAEGQMLTDWRDDGFTAKNPAVVARVRFSHAPDGQTVLATINVKYKTE